MNRVLRGLVGAVAIAASLTSASALAGPTLVHAGETATFNFDASALVPYAKVGIVVGFDEVDGIAEGGKFVFASDLDGNHGLGTYTCETGSDIALCVVSLEAFITNTSLFVDGNFSFVATNSGTGDAVFSVDPWAKVFVEANDTFFTRVDPNAAAVPEPATLALLGLGLAGLGFSRRKQ